MKKSAIAISIVMALGSTTASAAAMTTASFDMATPGGVFFAPDTAVTGSIGGGTWSVASPAPFFGVNWTAHSGTTFGPGTYSFDTLDGGTPGPSYTGIVVGAGQVGGHILFNWGTSLDIDVVNVWDITEASVDASNIEQTYTSIDVTVTTPAAESLDGIPGLSMIDGPFGGYNANFNFKVVVPDSMAPVISLTGANPQTISLGSSYAEQGATCVDAAPQGAWPTFLSPDSSAVDTTTGGIYTVTYDCTDTEANAATQVARTVVVAAPGPPLIALKGTDPVTQECGVTPYVDAGAICADFEDVLITGTDAPLVGDLFSIDQAALDTGLANLIAGLGQYTVTWSCRDSSLSTVTLGRTVDIVDTTAPVFTLNGADPINIVSSTPLFPVTYTDPGATAADACDTSPIAVTTVSNLVDVNAPDAGAAVRAYTVTYEAFDSELNKGTATRTVNVTRSQPVINLIGGNLILNIGDTYIEQGMDITDAQDGDLSAVTTSGTSPGIGAGARDLVYTIDSSAVDTNTQGTYSVTYNVTDFDGNKATQITRTVQVGLFAVDSNFTMLDAQGNVAGGTNDIVFDWDQTTNTSETDLNFNMTITSSQPFPFFGFVWTAHHTRVFGPGTYSFDTGCTVAEIEATGCPPGSAANSGATISMTIPLGYVGAHILFDWNTTSNIDVVNVWEIGGVWDQHGTVDPQNQLYNGLAGAAPDPATTWKLVSTDVNGDLVNGSPMVDGPFQGFYANFNAGPGGTAPPPEPYTGTAIDTDLGDSLLSSLNLWSLLAGLVTLVGLRGFGKRQHQ